MKNTLKILIGALLLALFTSCSEDELQVFDGHDNIYFLHKKWVYNSQGYHESYLDFEGSRLFARSAGLRHSAIDSMVVSMAFVNPELKTDTTFVPVVVAGKLAPYDREIAFRIDSTHVENAAVRGKHYHVPRAFIPANKNIGGIVVVMLRENIEAEKMMRVDFVLEENENFRVDFKEYQRTYGSEDLTSTLWEALYFTDGLTKPTYWLEAYWGPFTTKKAFLLNEVMEISWEDMYSLRPDLDRIMGIGNMLKVWLQQYKAEHGVAYTEEDGSEMVSGEYI